MAKEKSLQMQTNVIAKKSDSKALDLLKEIQRHNTKPFQ
jgi:hypothetical protein